MCLWHRLRGAALYVIAAVMFLTPSASLADLGCTPGAVDPVRGLTYGCTYRDVQKLGSMGRQIAADDVFDIVNALWTNSEITQLTTMEDGWTRFEAFDPAYGGLGDGTGGVDAGAGCGIATCPGGIFPTGVSVSDGTMLFSHHYSIEIGSFPSYPYVFKNNTPGLADFTGQIIPDSVWALFSAPPLRGAVDDESAQATYAGATSEAELDCTPNESDPLRGLTVGCTYMESQSIGSSGRRIAVGEDNHFLYAMWTGQDNNSADGGKLACFNEWLPETGTLADETGGVCIEPPLPPNLITVGTMSSLADGSIVAALNTNLSGLPGGHRTWIHKNSPGLFDLGGEKLPDSVWMSHAAAPLRGAVEDKSAQATYATATSEADLGCTPNESDPLRGLTYGCSFWEVQKFGSMGRQISTDSVFYIINSSWTKLDNNSATGGRKVSFDAFDPSYGTLADGTGGVDQTGFPPQNYWHTTLQGIGDGTSVTAHAWNPTWELGNYRSYVYKNATPGLADFDGTNIPDSVWMAFSEPPLRGAVDDESARAVYASASSAAELECTPATSDPARGLTFGCSTWDLQKLGSMGRQTATDSIFNVINEFWTYGNVPLFTNESYRGTRYEAFDPGFGALGDGTGGVDAGAWCDLVPCPGGIFTTAEAFSDGTSMLAHQWTHSPSLINYRAWTAKNSVPGISDHFGSQVSDSTWSSFAQESNESFVWPQIAHTDNGAEQVTHLLVSQWRSEDLLEDTLNQILYTRRVGATGDAWSLGMPLGETRQYRSAVVAAARNSSRVGIAWIGPRGDGTVSGAPIPRFDTLAGSEFDSDVYVMVSEDAGVTWGPRMNLTQRADSLPGGFAPQAKMSVAFDDNGDFHVVWQAVRWRGYGESTGKSGRMYHWSEATGGVSLAVDGVYENPQCGSGYNQLNIDNPQLSTCDGKLYLTYSEFASPWHGAADDCAERAQFSDGFAAANGEIYLAISADNGATWDDPRNLTATYTPDCDTIPGGVNPDCDSDAWHSTTRFGIDITGGLWNGLPDLSANLGGYGGVNYLFVSYINDADPGAAILAEGGWTINQVNVFRFGCVEATSGPVLASDLPDLIPDTDTLFIPSADTALSWILQNIGSADITDLSVTLNSVNPPGHMTLSGFGTTLLAGANNADTGVITLNAALASELAGASAEIVVDGSFPSAPRTYTVSYVVATPPPPPCCAVAGDFDHSGSFNIADVTSGIGYIFSGGPGPVCCEEADFNADGSFNISDVTFGIAYIFLGDLPLPCPPEGSVCGL